MDVRPYYHSAVTVTILFFVFIFQGEKETDLRKVGSAHQGVGMEIVKKTVDQPDRYTKTNIVSPGKLGRRLPITEVIGEIIRRRADPEDGYLPARSGRGGRLDRPG